MASSPGCRDLKPRSCCSLCYGAVDLAFSSPRSCPKFDFHWRAVRIKVPFWLGTVNVKGGRYKGGPRRSYTLIITVPLLPYPLHSFNPSSDASQSQKPLQPYIPRPKLLTQVGQDWEHNYGYSDCSRCCWVPAVALLVGSMLHPTTFLLLVTPATAGTTADTTNTPLTTASTPAEVITPMTAACH